MVIVVGDINKYDNEDPVAIISYRLLRQFQFSMTLLPKNIRKFRNLTHLTVFYRYRYFYYVISIGKPCMTLRQSHRY